MKGNNNSDNMNIDQNYIPTGENLECAAIKWNMHEMKIIWLLKV